MSSFVVLTLHFGPTMIEEVKHSQPCEYMSSAMHDYEGLMAVLYMQCGFWGDYHNEYVRVGH